MNDQNYTTTVSSRRVTGASAEPTGFKLFLMNNGLKVALVGFALTSAGMLTVMAVKDKNAILHNVGFGVAACGLAFYLIGRVGIVMHNRARAKMVVERESSDDETSGA